MFSILFKYFSRKFNGDVFLLVFVVLGVSNNFELGARLGVFSGVGSSACSNVGSSDGSGAGSGALSGVGLADLQGTCSGLVFCIRNTVLPNLLIIFYLALKNNPMLLRKCIFSTIFAPLFKTFDIMTNLLSSSCQIFLVYCS